MQRRNNYSCFYLLKDKSKILLFANCFLLIALRRKAILTILIYDSTQQQLYLNILYLLQQRFKLKDINNIV